MKDQQMNNIESQTSNLTTEEFHKLLADNTAELNKLRMFYAENLAKMHDEYNDDMESFLAQEHQAKDEFHDAREAYEEAVNKYELHILSLRKSRNEAGHKYNIGKADLKNYWAKKTKKSRASATTSSSAIEILGGYSRKRQKVSCTQAGPETRKEG